MPYGEYNEQELLEYFERIWEREQQMSDEQKDVFREIFEQNVPKRGRVHP